MRCKFRTSSSDTQLRPWAGRTWVWAKSMEALSGVIGGGAVGEGAGDVPVTMWIDAELPSLFDASMSPDERARKAVPPVKSAADDTVNILMPAEPLIASLNTSTSRC